MLLHLPHIFGHGDPLLVQIAVDRAPEARIGNPVRRPGLRRLEAARHFVLALRAGFEALQALLDTVLDSLVIARLEMQAVKLGRGAPIASVERVAAAEEDRGRNRRALQLGELHDDCAGECCRDRAEELRIEIVLVAAHLEGAGRKSEHDAPQPRVHFLASQRAELNAVLLHTSALAQGLLALVGAERREKGVEARVAAVVPVELAILAPEGLARTERSAV